MRRLVDVTALRQAGLGAEQAEHDTRHDIMETVVGVIAAVYPIDHPENGTGQTLVDVQLAEHLAPWRKIPLGATHAHGETHPAAPLTRRRQPYARKARHQMQGAVADVRPGTRVLVNFLHGDLRAPVITGILKFNRQGESGLPAERRGVDRFKDGKLLDMVEVNPVDSCCAEYPRAVDEYNGTRLERDNCGNLTVQTTTDRAPVFPGHNGIPQSPTPEGNIGMSTRGARIGNQGRTTGQNPLTGETSDDGSIRDETIQAKLGHYIVRLRSLAGRLYGSTRGSGDGRVYLEGKDRSYLSLDGDHAELSGAGQVTLDGDTVNLGNDDPPYTAVLWEVLNQFLEEFMNAHDGHKHEGVESGNDTSGLPTVLIKPSWLTTYQLGTAYQSDNVHLVKAESATPETQDDPHGEEG